MGLGFVFYEGVEREELGGIEEVREVNGGFRGGEGVEGDDGLFISKDGDVNFGGR